MELEAAPVRVLRGCNGLSGLKKKATAKKKKAVAIEENAQRPSCPNMNSLARQSLQDPLRIQIRGKQDIWAELSEGLSDTNLNPFSTSLPFESSCPSPFPKLCKYSFGAIRKGEKKKRKEKKQFCVMMEGPRPWPCSWASATLCSLFLGTHESERILLQLASCGLSCSLARSREETLDFVLDDDWREAGGGLGIFKQKCQTFQDLTFKKINKGTWLWKQAWYCLLEEKKEEEEDSSSIFTVKI